MIKFARFESKDRISFTQLFLFGAALVVGAVYLYCDINKGQIEPIFPEHQSIFAYNFYKYGSLNKIYEGRKYVAQGVAGTGDMLANPEPPIVQDTIAYGVIMGLLWKLFGSSSFLPVQVLQILLLAFSLLLLLSAFTILFKNSVTAFCASFSVLLFFPLSFLNIQPTKDIWGFYGIVALLYCAVYYLEHKELQFWPALPLAVWFAICQWTRTPLFAGLCSFSFFLLFYCFLKREYLLQAKKVLLIFWLTNLFVFWIPWMTYNKITYNRYTVGVFGQVMMESMGELPNKWGAEVSDAWVAEYLQKEYGMPVRMYGTPEFDDLAQKAFWKMFKEDPLHYFKSLSLRIASLFVRSFAFCRYKTVKTLIDWDYHATFSQYLYRIKSAWDKGFVYFLTFMFFIWYTRVLYSFAWMGIFTAFVQRQYLSLILLLGGVFCGSFGMIISHFEGRYVIPYYFGIIAFSGYFVGECIEYSRKKAWLRKFYSWKRA